MSLIGGRYMNDHGNTYRIIGEDIPNGRVSLFNETCNLNGNSTYKIEWLNGLVRLDLIEPIRRLKKHTWKS